MSRTAQRKRAQPLAHCILEWSGRAGASERGVGQAPTAGHQSSLSARGLFTPSNALCAEMARERELSPLPSTTIAARVTTVWLGSEGHLGEPSRQLRLLKCSIHQLVPHDLYRVVGDLDVARPCTLDFAQIKPSSEHDAKPLTDSCARAPLLELCDSVPRPKAVGRGPDRANDNKKPRRALGVSRARDLRVEQATVSLIRRAADSENLLVIRIEA
jgi:hypothetical protein